MSHSGELVGLSRQQFLEFPPLKCQLLRQSLELKPTETRGDKLTWQHTHQSYIGIEGLSLPCRVRLVVEVIGSQQVN